MKKLLTVFACFLFSCPFFGQDSETVSGIAGRAIWRDGLTDGNGNTVVAFDSPIVSARVTLITGRDTLVTTTDKRGSFRFLNLRTAPVQLVLEAAGFQSFSQGFYLVPGENVVLVELRKSLQDDIPEVLDAAKIEAEIPVATMKGDTLVYNAAAVALQQGDYAIDLLKQMPGVEVKDRQILISGKHIRRTYVNGALIFGLDPMAGMENLQGQQVTQFYVYDEDNPQNRLDGSMREQDRVIDIRTKDPIFSVTDLQLRLMAGADGQRAEGGGQQLRYAAGVNGKYFSELRQLRTDLITDNLGMTTSLLYAEPHVQSQYEENTVLHLGYDRFWSSPLYGNGVQLNYDYGHSWTKAQRRALTEYFETAGIPSRAEESIAHNEIKLRTHALTLAAAYKTHPKFRITWRNSIQISDTDLHATNRGTTAIPGYLLMERNEHTRAKDFGWTVDESVDVSLHFGRIRPLVSIGVVMGRNNRDGWILDTLSSSYSRRYLTKDGKGLSNEIRASVSQQLFLASNVYHNFVLRGEYRFMKQHRTQEQAAFDLFGADTPRGDKTNTFDYTYSGDEHSIGLNGDLSFNRGPRSSLLRFSLHAVSNRINDEESIPSSNTWRKTFYSLRPSLALSLFQGSVSLNYDMSGTIPSAEQLRARIDNASPLFLKAGNPGLGMSRIHTVSVHAGKLGLSSAQLAGGSFQRLSGNATISYMSHPIISQTMFFPIQTELPVYGYIVPAGASLMTWDQADRLIKATASLTYQNRSTWFGGKWKPTWTIKPSLSYSELPEYYGPLLDRTVEWNPTMDVTSAQRGREFSLSINGRGSYLHAINGHETLNMEAVHFSLGAEAEWKVLNVARLRADYNWSQTRNLTRGSLDLNYHRLNALLGISLLGRKMELAIIGLDLLNGGSLYSSSFGSSSFSQIWTPVYGRCFLVSATWRFNSSGGSKLFPSVSL